MADIRIKDLTTTASSTASDDFIAVDGTTNGTRKLNAFSPTFGGNATVTGTLTVNGIGPHAFSGALTINPSSGDIQQNFQRSGTGKGILSVPGTAGNIVADSAVDDFVVRTTSGKAFRVTTDGGNTSSLSVATATVSVLATTASTSTSSGALVVSGGVGVAGAVFSGGYIHPGNDSGFYLRGTGTGNGLWYGNYVSADVAGAFSIRNAAGSSTYFAVDGSNVTISSGVGLKLGNTYTAGAPTATGYIVIKDSTGTSYKIPAVAL
jgi:hypothetical protein